MALQKLRTRIFVHGLGTLQVREVDPTPATSFSDVGYLKNFVLNDGSDMVDIVTDNGHMAEYLRQKQKVMVDANLFQLGEDEINLLKNADGKQYAMRYHGLAHNALFQYFAFDNIKLNPSLNMQFQPGERLIPLNSVAVFQDLAYDIPLYYNIDAMKEMSLNNLSLWVVASLGKNVGTAKLLDISGFGRHGTINSDFATIWQAGTPTRFLRLDGVNDQVDFGNILTMNATDDFLFEIWVRIQGADGSAQEIFSKKADDVHTDGYRLVRDASNNLSFKLSDGAASATVVSAATQLQNVWKKIAVAVDRNGNGQVYVNGVASGAPVSVAAIADSTSTDSLIMGKLSTGFGQIDFDDFRVHNYGAGGLPSDVATIALNHYNAQKAKYGL